MHSILVNRMGSIHGIANNGNIFYYKCYFLAKQLSTNTILGRHLVATRPIRSGEVIFRESPLILGPKTASVPVCLGCQRNLDPITTGDAKVRWQLNSEQN